jgi:hypothetical protein
LSLVSFLGLPFDFGGEAAAVQLQAYRVTYGDLRGVTDDVAGGVGGDGVAAFEDASGAALFELQAQSVEAVALDAKDAFAADGKFMVAAFELTMQARNFRAEIKRQ